MCYFRLLSESHVSLLILVKWFGSFKKYQSLPELSQNKHVSPPLFCSLMYLCNLLLEIGNMPTLVDPWEQGIPAWWDGWPGFILFLPPHTGFKLYELFCFSSFFVQQLATQSRRNSSPYLGTNSSGHSRELLVRVFKPGEQWYWNWLLSEMYILRVCLHMFNIRLCFGCRFSGELNSHVLWWAATGWGVQGTTRLAWMQRYKGFLLCYSLIPVQNLYSH